MPHYQFECHNCQNNFEIELKMAELNAPHSAKQCPECESTNVFQVINFQGAVGVTSHKNSPPPNCGGCGNNQGSSCPWQN